MFEKDKKLVCVPFYADTADILSRIAYNFFKEKKISISQANINLIVNKCNGDRGVLKNELLKIEFFCQNKKEISTDLKFKRDKLIDKFQLVSREEFEILKKLVHKQEKNIEEALFL